MGISNYPKPFLLGILNYPKSKYVGNCCYPGQEWRITHLNRLEREGRLTVIDSAKHQYVLKLNPCDVKILVFPDEKTQIKAFKNSKFSKLIEKPICLTIDDCEHF